MGQLESDLWIVGLAIFLIAWFVFVPIAMTSRLERIIRLLEDLKKGKGVI